MDVDSPSPVDVDCGRLREKQERSYRLWNEMKETRLKRYDQWSQVLALEDDFLASISHNSICDAEVIFQRLIEARDELQLTQDLLETLENEYQAVESDLRDEESRLYDSGLSRGKNSGRSGALSILIERAYPRWGLWDLWDQELEDEGAFEETETSKAGKPLNDYSIMRPENPKEDRKTSPRQSRRGRGQRKNNAYWNWREQNTDLGVLDRDILVSGKNGNLTVPGIARLDWSFGTPFCISEKYLKQQGRCPDIDANITDVERHSVSGNQLDIAGIIRNFPFRVKGTSRVFFQDFIVSKALDDVVDMVIGWQFMLEEFKLLFDNVREKFAGVFGEVVSNFSSKIAKVFSALRNRASELISRSPSPSPPYSLCDVFEPDFTVRPKYS